mgnify:FL=1
MTGNERKEEIKNEFLKLVIEREWSVKDIYDIEQTLMNVIDSQKYSIEDMILFADEDIISSIILDFQGRIREYLTKIIVDDLDSAVIKMNISPVVLPEKKKKEKVKTLPSKEELREQIKKDTKQV